MAKAPTFLVMAMKDLHISATDLQNIQMIKGWVDPKFDAWNRALSHWKGIQRVYRRVLKNIFSPER